MKRFEVKIGYPYNKVNNAIYKMKSTQSYMLDHNNSLVMMKFWDHKLYIWSWYLSDKARKMMGYYGDGWTKLK